MGIACRAGQNLEGGGPVLGLFSSDRHITNPSYLVMAVSAVMVSRRTCPRSRSSRLTSTNGGTGAAIDSRRTPEPAGRCSGAGGHPSVIRTGPPSVSIERQLAWVGTGTQPQLCQLSADLGKLGIHHVEDPRLPDGRLRSSGTGRRFRTVETDRFTGTSVAMHLDVGTADPEAMSEGDRSPAGCSSRWSLRGHPRQGHRPWPRQGSNGEHHSPTRRPSSRGAPRPGGAARISGDRLPRRR